MKKLLLPVLTVLALGLTLPLYGVNVPITPASAATGTILVAQQAQAVTIQNFAFSPASLTVAAGTTVTWTNKDTTAHTVTVDSGSGPNSGPIQPGQSYSFTFQQPGTYGYHCSIHPQMKATVVVSSAPTPTPSPAPSTSQPPSGSTTPQQPSSKGGTSAPSQSAAGPVEAGSGSVATSRYVTPLIAGSLAIVVGVALFFARRLQFLHR